MKKISPFILFLLFLASCGTDKPEKQESKQEMAHFGSIITPAHGQYIKSGEDLIIEFSLAQRPSGFSKVEISIDGEIIFASDEFQSSYTQTINTSSMTMGLHEISAVVFVGKKTEVNTSTILITSDVIPEMYTYIVRNKYPHDINAYTQGLEFHDGILYEGTGLNGKSELRKVDLRSGAVLKSQKLDQQYFGEGITIIDGKIYQLTYQSNKGFVYDLNSFDLLKEFTYATEGWGLTHDESNLIMSDGTNRLYFLDKETYERKKTLEVYDNIGPVNMLNELEYIEGEIWANVYLSQEVMRIDPKSGKVTGKINLSGIFEPSSVSHKVDVLNGIAYDEKTKKIHVTGKLWPNIYEIEILNQ